jgi:Uma2 family endonuclease
LIDGIPHAMRPMPVPRHQQIASALNAEFHFHLKKCKQCATYQPLDYRIADDIILQPDMLVICGKINNKYLDFPPALVAEILSHGTFLKDRHTKFSIYEAQGISYYLILSPENEEAEVYELEDKAFILKQKGRNFVYSFKFGDCKAAIDFAEVW